MWAINLDAATTAITTGQPQSWVRLQNRSTAGWSGRAGFTLVRYGGDIILYGGYKSVREGGAEGATRALPCPLPTPRSYDLTQLFPPQDPLTVCLNPLANCNVYTDIWEYRPGSAWEEEEEVTLLTGFHCPPPSQSSRTASRPAPPRRAATGSSARRTPPRSPRRASFTPPR